MCVQRLSTNCDAGERPASTVSRVQPYRSCMEWNVIHRKWKWGDRVLGNRVRDKI